MSTTPVIIGVTGLAFAVAALILAVLVLSANIALFRFDTFDVSSSEDFHFFLAVTQVTDANARRGAHNDPFLAINEVVVAVTGASRVT